METAGRKRVVLGAGIALAAVLLLVFYYITDPQESVWMPQCMFHFLTGWECPACGNQRALHQLLHGNLEMAFRYNPFLILSIPYLCAVMYVSFVRTPRAVRWRPFVLHPCVVRGYVVLIIGWWILRNLPFVRCRLGV